MAKKKAIGSRANQKSNVPGKRLGVKLFGGQRVKAGQIIVRQRGTKYLPGKNVDLGRDHTIYSVAEGEVKFSKNNKGRTIVNVISEEEQEDN